MIAGIVRSAAGAADGVPVACDTTSAVVTAVTAVQCRYLVVLTMFDLVQTSMSESERHCA